MTIPDPIYRPGDNVVCWDRPAKVLQCRYDAMLDSEGELPGSWFYCIEREDGRVYCDIPESHLAKC